MTSSPLPYKSGGPGLGAELSGRASNKQKALGSVYTGTCIHATRSSGSLSILDQQFLLIWVKWLGLAQFRNARLTVLCD